MACANILQRGKPAMSSPISEAELSSLKQDVKTGKPVLTIRDMHISYFPRGKEVKAVRGVDLTVHAGETLALVVRVAREKFCSVRVDARS